MKNETDHFGVQVNTGLLFGGIPFRISTQTPALLTVIFVVFLSTEGTNECQKIR